MVKPNTIGMIEKYGNVESVTAKGELFNGALVTVTNGEATVSATATHLVDYFKTGDEMYTDFKVAIGEQIAVRKLADWVGKELVVSPANIAYGGGENYTKLVEGTTLLGANAEGKFAIISTAPATTGTVYFKVVKKVNFAGDGVKVQILVK